MAEKGFKSWVKPILLTVIASVLVAWIIGEGSLFEGISLVDQADKLKSTVAARESTCEFKVVNHLLIPTHLAVNDEFIDTLKPNSSKTYRGHYCEKTLSFESNSPYQSSNKIEGYWKANIEDGGEFEISNIVGDNHYFFVEITNVPELSCEVYVNRGFESEKYAGSTDGGNTFKSGYFPLFSNSNIVMVCDDGKTISWGDYGSIKVNYSIYENTLRDSGMFTGNFPSE